MKTPKHLIDIRSFKYTRETVAYHEGGQFPVLVTLPDGSLIAVVRGDAGHLGISGRIEIIRSYDAGHSWTPPNVVANSSRDDRNPALGVSEEGTIILAYECESHYDAAGNYVSTPKDASSGWNLELFVTRSLDKGLTWEEPQPLNNPLLRDGSPYGKIVTLGDGSLLMAVYGRPIPEIMGDRFSQVKPTSDCSYVIRSRDDGKTWNDPVLVAPNMNETALLVLLNGTLLAMMRDEAEGALYSSQSPDGGYTWYKPVRVTQAGQHPADLLLLKDGSILLVYGNRNDSACRIEGLISRNGGHYWHDCLLLFSGKLRGYSLDAPYSADFGYPSSAQCPIVPTGAVDRQTTVVTLYYVNPAIPRGVPVERSEGNRLYSSQGYSAIAVIWDENELLDAVNRCLS